MSLLYFQTKTQEDRLRAHIRPNHCCKYMYIIMIYFHLLYFMIALIVCQQSKLDMLRVGEVRGSIPSQGPRHTKDVIKMVPVVPLFATQH